MKKSEAQRYAAILALQQKQEQLDPDSYAFQVHDKAIDLALSPNRKVDEHFMDYLLSDARQILRRAGRNFPTVSIEGSLTDERSGEIAPIAVDENDPMSQMILSEDYHLLLNAATNCHEHGEAIFMSMIDGVKVVDTAKTLAISEALVKKIRSRIRSLAETIMNK